MKYLTTLLFTVSLLWMLPENGQAQLIEVKQTVYGMDCAPCAYALENRINKMEGVSTASVSLNDGLLTAALTNENTLTLKQIRKAVTESGFSPKKAEVKVSGTLQKEDGQYFLISSSDERYKLQVDDEAVEGRLKSTQAGESITLAGLLPQEESAETGYWTLIVDSSEL